MAYSYSDKLAELHAYAPAVASEAGDRPMASRVARFQASHDTTGSLTTPRAGQFRRGRPLSVEVSGWRPRPGRTRRSPPGRSGGKGYPAVRRTASPLKILAESGNLLAEGLDKKLGWLASASLLLGRHDPGIHPGSPMAAA